MKKNIKNKLKQKAFYFLWPHRAVAGLHSKVTKSEACTLGHALDNSRLAPASAWRYENIDGRGYLFRKEWMAEDPSDGYEVIEKVL